MRRLRVVGHYAFGTITGAMIGAALLGLGHLA